jgi:uncharacterized protein YggE
MKYLLALMLALASSSSAAAAASPKTPPTTITVTGQGTVTRSPDYATIQASLITNDNDEVKAASENNAGYETLKNALLRAGVAEADIVTTYYNVNNFNNLPRPMAAAGGSAIYPYPYGQRSGFVVTRQLEIKVRAIDRVGAAIDACISANATAFSGVSYNLNNPRSAYAQALHNAVLDASAQAGAMVSAAHMRIVKVQSLQSGYAPLPVPMLRAKAAAVTAVPVPPTTIRPSNINVQATVTVTYVVAPLP